jgi:hypothetical protein
MAPTNHAGCFVSSSSGAGTLQPECAVLFGAPQSPARLSISRTRRSAIHSVDFLAGAITCLFSPSIPVAPDSAQLLLNLDCRALFPAESMKKYLVFTYYVGRSFGGMKDYLDRFESIEEALDNILAERNRYYQVVDGDSMEVVKEGLAIFKNFIPEKFNSDDEFDFGK